MTATSSLVRFSVDERAIPYSGASPRRDGPLKRSAEAVSRVAQARFTPSFDALVSDRAPFMSDSVYAGQDVSTDISFVGRAVLDFTATGSTALNATLGNSTGINAFLGYRSYQLKKDQEERARLAGYDEGVRSKQLDRARCATQMVGGGMFFGIRALTLASYVKGVDTSSATAPTLLGRVTFVAQSAGSAIWGLVYALLAGVCGLGLYEGYKLRKEIEAVERGEKNMAGLGMSFLREFSLKELKKEAIDCFVQQLKNDYAAKKKGPIPCLRDLRAEVLRIAKQEAAEQGKEVFLYLAEQGERWKAEKCKAARFLKVSALTSKTCARALNEKGEFDPVDRALLTEMKAALDKNFWINLGYLVTCLIGLASTIALFVATGGIAPLLITIGFFVVALMMTALDGYSLYEAISSPERQGAFDTRMLTLSTGIAFVSFIGSIILVSMLSLGLAPLLMAICIFLFWACINIKVWSALPSQSGRVASAPVLV